MKRVICLLLVACFMVVALVSCGGNGDVTDGSGADDSANATTEKPTDEYGQVKFTSAVPEGLDYQGETLKILHRDQVSVQREWYKETPEDDLDEMIAMRNDTVADTLNVTVQYEKLGSSLYADCLSAFTKAIQEDVDMDFHYYDIVANYAYAGASPAVRDKLANLADKDVFPYFNFELPCWNQAIVDTTLINDQLYYITGDINLSTFDKTMVIFINKKMYNDKAEDDDPEDLQDLALEGYDSVNKVGVAGGFTYDDLYRWSTVFEETNGEAGSQHDDFHAISAGYGSIPLDAFPYAWDLDYIVENADGTHSYDIVGNNKIETAITKAQNLLNGQISQGVCNDDNTERCSIGGYSEPITHFANNKSIFTLHILYNNEQDNLMLREMEAEFGLLPMPKYDEDQLDYGTTAHDAYTLMTVIDHSGSSIPTKGEEICAYLQLSTEESYTNVRGYYINRIVKPKYFGVNDSVSKSIEIFNIIADHVEFTFISIYAPQLNSVLNSCWRNVVTGSSAATTAKDAYESDQANFDTAMAEVDTWLQLA